MERPTPSEVLWLAVGTLLISLGGTMAVLYSFQRQFIPVYAGIFLFVLGYKVSWYGSKPDEWARHKQVLLGHINEHNRGDSKKLSKDITMLFIGGTSTAYGVFLFAQTVQSPSLVNAIISGLFSFGGYMIAHRQINKALI